MSFLLFLLGFVKRVLDEAATVAKRSQNKQKKKIKNNNKRVKDERNSRQPDKNKARKLGEKEMKWSNRWSWTSAAFG